ncbi:hypothetical protein EGR_04529 [Echinococcus granulosus]|uniref:Uncharacterized protein n=1 Tax=Echinococcus granulosus TaxID=6210 RepID=W6UHZ3_ECHGR|nr:hypothetical protein EGR_04529 [Echinococcus granulosus]EUB60696.1 hypothetical protein EGR_04529 [Echinococcus granulosus]
MRTRASERRLTRSRSSLTIQNGVKSSSTATRVRCKGKSRSSVRSVASRDRVLRSSRNRKVHVLQSQSKQSSNKPRKQPVSSRSSEGVASSRKSERQTRNGLPDASQSLSASKAKRRKAGKTRDERSEDPYELSEDENEAPAAIFGSPSAPCAAISSIDKKRKFFPTRREGSTNRAALSGFDILRRKLTAKSRSYRRPASAADQTSSSRAAPMSESERARIAATTIWLPLPNQQCASTPDRQHPQRMQPQILSLPPPDERSEILTGNPAVRLSSLSVLASPLDSRTVKPNNTPLESTAVMPHEGSAHDAPPLADISNISPRPPLSAYQVGDKIHSEARRISFAQPLSPIPKRSSGSRGRKFELEHAVTIGVDTVEAFVIRRCLRLATTGCTTSLVDANYEQWLEEFNSQLKPYEEFDLTID